MQTKSVRVHHPVIHKGCRSSSAEMHRNFTMGLQLCDNANNATFLGCTHFIRKFMSCSPFIKTTLSHYDADWKSMPLFKT